MKKILATIAIAALQSAASFLSAQTIYLCKDGSYTTKDITDGLEISLTEGLDSITFTKPQIEAKVSIVYSGTTATVTIPSFLSGVTCTSGTSTNVVISSTNLTDEVIYAVSGSSANGSLTIIGDYKLTLQLNGVDLTSTTGAAIDVQCGKRVAVVLGEGTTNSLADCIAGPQKACLQTKGHFEFSGAGTLNVSGNSNHAIRSKEYTQIKKSVKAINIVKAANDAIHVGQYFQMNGGEVNITSTTVNDGIQVEYETDDNDAIIVEEENTAGVFIKGGTINITLENAEDAKGIKAEGDIAISGGTFTIDANSNGSRGIQTDRNMTIDETNGTTSILINAAGGKCTVAADSEDPHRCMGIKVEGDLTINAGTVTVYNTGKKSKGIKVDGTYTQNCDEVYANIDNGN